MLQPIIDFFALRRFFTLRSLRACWWIYLFALAFQLYLALYLHLAHLPGPTFYLWFRVFIWIDAILLPLPVCAAVMTARLLVEVTMEMLSIPRRSATLEENPRSGWQTLEAFVELTPLVTRGWLEAFWRLFLVATAWVVIKNILLGPSIFSSVAGAITYVAAVRLLLEAATRLFLPGTAPAAESGAALPRRFSGFFSARPFLTAGDIKFFWWLYILVELHRLYLRLATFTLVGSLPPALYWYMWDNVIVAPVMTVSTIVTARLFLEVVTLGPPQAGTAFRTPRSFAGALADFIDLRPFFTSSRLRLFWYLFLFTIAADIFGYVSLVPGQQPILHWVPYVMAFLTPLYCAVGVRLLIEAAYARAGTLPNDRHSVPR